MGGWEVLLQIFLFLALWDFGNQVYGDLVLPNPEDVFLWL